jgi:hypothetical protein
MAPRNSLILFLFLSLVAVSQCATGVYFYDSEEGTFFRRIEGQKELSVQGLSAIAASLLSVQSNAIDGPVSEQVDSVITPDVFSRPIALAAIHVAGASGQSLADKPSIAASLAATGAPAGSLLQAVAGLASSTHLEQVALDYTTLPGCSDACIETILQAVLPVFAANYTQGAGPLKGALSLPDTSSEASGHIELNLEQPADRLFAVELAALQQTVQDAIAEIHRRKAQEPTARQPPQLLETTLISIQALSGAYGPDSPQVAAAWRSMRAVLHDCLQQLQEGYNHRIATYIALLDDVQLPGAKQGKLKGLLLWREHHRHMLAAGANDYSTTAFVAWVCAWAVFIILLAFAFSGCHCLTNMKFKQDTLLYGKSRAD